MNDPHPATQAVTVRPKQQSALTQRDIRSVLNSSQAQTTQVDPDDQQTGSESYLNTVCNENTQNDAVNIMQRQSDITALLVQQNVTSALPTRNILVFDGNPLQFQSY